ncbi:hypothetical protein LFYK43_09670 [Ligilactobacillus salitolerans]|uniref:Uncharacterized protein n=1 Tax=Ligilactobacillus salitolerans TaxID=1808352 RepID=A0A401ISK3_9LACO|nr:hypothetical protein [Ligilactobacillus salitolerans]GBG94508.1 hypothetical protein LFYK43_09670 [Ligilactobacillus salitolerans]
MNFYTYNSFEKKSGALTFAEAEEIYSELTGLVEIAGQETQELWDEFVKVAVTYAGTRGTWLLLSSQEKAAIDDRRTNEHDAVIYQLTLLKRIFDKQGLPAEWFDQLRLDSVRARKRFGDFACYVAYIYGVNAR